MLHPLENAVVGLVLDVHFQPTDLDLIAPLADS